MAKPFGGNGPPAALFHDSRDRGGTHPRGHPAGWSGILQADAYAGFNGLYAKGRAPAPLGEVLDLLGIWQEVHPLRYRI